jgi:hypothetical protein
MDPGLLKCLERGADWELNSSHISDFLLFQYVFSSVKGVVLMMTCLIKICHSEYSKLDTPWPRPVNISNKQFLKALKLYINSMKN